MDMTLSKRGDYVMRAAIALGRAFDGGPEVLLKVREVVADTEIPQTYAPQILADLVRVGLVVSKAGRGGGYRLTRPPGMISVLEVIEAAEGPLRAERCALGDGPCRWEKVCPLHETWSEASSKLRELLADTTLLAIAMRDAAIEAGTYEVAADAHRSHPVAIEIVDALQVELSASELMAALTSAKTKHDLLVLVETACQDHGFARAPAIGTSPTSSYAELATDTATTSRGGATDDVHCLLRWDLVAPAPGCRFEAELTVVTLDQARCELRVAGSWRQGASGPMLDVEELDVRARTSLRSFLRLLARCLEDQAEAVKAPQHGFTVRA